TVPFWLIQCGAKIGDWIGRSAINTTGINLLQHDNIAQDGDYQRLQQTLSFSPCGFDEGLMKQPSQIQDRWHARLYFIKPLLRSSIAILWIWTAIVSLFLFPHELSYQILSAFGLSAKAKSMALITGGIIDGVLGILCLLNIKIRWVGTIQIVLITIYSLLISVFLPDFWLDPFGPIAKNIPLIFATLTMIALEPNR
ncbi:MAG: DoxX-like family protein, partial [Coxiellaceae bacterium]|nr:DoxX-like family protein [Coxiellaceae bacterium]